MELTALNLSRRYLRATGDANCFEAVHPVDLTLRGGEMTLLSGRSGSGKTTLLTMLSGLLRPSTGTVALDGRDLYSLSDADLSKLRAARFAVIPQGASAISSLTLMENILFPAALAGKPQPTDRARALMERLDILSLARVWPGELSGGELRRMAIVRALAASPDVIFADEPTADLDDENTAAVLELLRETAHQGAVVFTVSHEPDAASYADRLLRMNAGTVTEETKGEGRPIDLSQDKNAEKFI